MSPIISISSPEPAMLASKWLSTAVLIDAEELSSLFQFLGDFYIYEVGRTTVRGQGFISKGAFVEQYQKYVAALKTGHLPEEHLYRNLFAAVFTVDLEALYAVAVGENQQVIRPRRPVIQLQPHRMGFSEADGKFRSKTYGPDTITWGIQFSYPQLFQDPKTHEVMSVGISPFFLNTELFHKIQKWVRQNTSATPFIVKEQRINVPMRLGKQCFSWINNHPQLKSAGIRVAERSTEPA